MNWKYLPGNIFAYNATISACEKGGQWQQAVNFFEAMWTEHIVPDIVSYNTIISIWLLISVSVYFWMKCTWFDFDQLPIL